MWRAYIHISMGFLSGSVNNNWLRRFAADNATRNQGTNAAAANPRRRRGHTVLQGQAVL